MKKGTDFPPKTRQSRKREELAMKADIPFLSDSAEQIYESIDGMGLRDKLHQAVQAAIARANRSQQSSNPPTIEETEKVDSANEAPLK